MEHVYICFLCTKEFKDAKTVFAHFKFNHFIKDNTVEMKCIVKGSECTNVFNCFASLKSHLKKCPGKNIENQAAAFESQEIGNNRNDILMFEDPKLTVQQQITTNRIENRENYFTFEGITPTENSSKHGQSITENVESMPHVDFHQTDKFCEEMMDNFLGSFAHQISQLKMTYEQTTVVYNLSLQFAENIHKFIEYLIQEDNGFDAIKALLVSSKVINARLAERSTKFKRTKRFESDPLYVAPRELGLGVRFDMSRADDLSVAVPRLIQCKFHYMPIIDTIISLFRREDFRKVYFEHNKSNQQKALTGKNKILSFFFSINSIYLWIVHLISNFYLLQVSTVISLLVKISVQMNSFRHIQIVCKLFWRQMILMYAMDWDRK